jgi:hypothetical protein
LFKMALSTFWPLSWSYGSYVSPPLNMTLINSSVQWGVLDIIW